MIDKFTIVLDWFDRFFKRFKAVGYVVAIIFIGIYFIENGFERKEAERLAEKITGLNLREDILIKEKKVLKNERDSITALNQILKAERDSVLKIKEYFRLQASKERIEKENALKAIEFFTSDESYRFLQDVAYPFLGDAKYGFNEKQVKEIHHDYVNGQYNEQMLESKSIELEQCELALSKSLNIENSAEKAYAVAEKEIVVSDSITSIEKEKVDVLMGEDKKFFGKVWDFGKKTWKYVGPALGLLVGLAL